MPKHMRQAAFLSQILSFISLLCFLPSAFAQASRSNDSVADTSPPTISSGASAGATDSDSNAAILKELREMRSRIQELEAQLSARSSGNSQDAGATPHDEHDPVPKSDLKEAASGVAMISPEPTAEGAGKQASEPFAFADFSWLSGNARTKDTPYATKFFTPEIRFDVNYTYDFNHPADNTIGGSSEIFRHNEFQLTQLGVGGDFHFDNVRGRLMTQFGMYSQTQPRSDASTARGQWNLSNAYQYLAEAYGGYHFNKLHGINVDAGIFMSYIGLWSFYNFDNWTYQPSYVSSNTPWFFNGVRAQIFPTAKLKIEPWFINGWQSYGRFNNRPGLGLQVLYRPNGK